MATRDGSVAVVVVPALQMGQRHKALEARAAADKVPLAETALVRP